MLSGHRSSWRNSGKKIKYEVQRSYASWLNHAQLFSYDVQIYLPIGDAHHGGLGPSTSIKTISQTCSQANQGHFFI